VQKGRAGKTKKKDNPLLIERKRRKRKNNALPEGEVRKKGKTAR